MYITVTGTATACCIKCYATGANCLEAASSHIKPIFGGSCHKYHFCRDRHVFVATNICLDKNIWSRQTKVLSRQAYFCRYRRCVLSRQTRVCRDKSKTTLMSAPANDKSQTKEWRNQQTALAIRTTAGRQQQNWSKTTQRQIWTTTNRKVHSHPDIHRLTCLGFEPFYIRAIHALCFVSSVAGIPDWASVPRMQTKPMLDPWKSGCNFLDPEAVRNRRISGDIFLSALAQLINYLPCTKKYVSY